MAKPMTKGRSEFRPIISDTDFGWNILSQNNNNTFHILLLFLRFKDACKNILEFWRLEQKVFFYLEDYANLKANKTTFFSQIKIINTKLLEK